MGISMKKLWFAFGDSITDMGYYIDTVCRDLDLECGKYGFSGYSFGVDEAPYGCLLDACEKMLQDDRTPDIITLFGGSNDFGHSSSIESTEENLCRIIEQLQAKWPGAKLLVILPLQRDFQTDGRSWETAGLGPNKYGLYLWDYARVIQSVAGKYGIPVLDLYHEAWLTKENALTYTLDGLHPTPAYGISLGHQIAEAMKALL